MRRILATALLIALALPGCLSNLVDGNRPGPKDYVSSQDYSTWVIEVDTVEGMSAPSSAIDLLKTRLNSVANKPGGIEVRFDDTLPQRGGSWSLKDVTQYSDAHLDAETGGSTAVIHLLFLDGSYDDSNALGVTISSLRNGKVVASGPIAIFSESIRAACNITTLCTDDTPIWGPVLVHEFGHAMGLVNNGIPMVKPHEAETCDSTGQPVPDEGHSSNPNSVMDCSVETSNILSAFSGRSIPSNYDADDRADICAAGGKCG